MFASRYFAIRYYAPRYWPKVGGDPPSYFPIRYFAARYYAPRYWPPDTVSAVADKPILFLGGL